MKLYEAAGAEKPKGDNSYTTNIEGRFFTLLS